MRMKCSQRESVLVIRHGFMATMLRWRTEKFVRLGPTWNSYLWFFFYVEGIIHHEFLSGQTLYQWYYLEILIYLRENVRRKGVNCGKKQLMVLPSWQPCMHHCWFVTSVQKWRWLCLPILPICVKDCDTVMLFSLHREDILFCTLVTVFLYMGVTQIKLHSY